MNGQYSSILKMNYLQSSDTGTYTCSASVIPDPASAFIRESEVISKKETIAVGELVGIISKGSGPLSKWSKEVLPLQAIVVSGVCK